MRAVGRGRHDLDGKKMVYIYESTPTTVGPAKATMVLEDMDDSLMAMQISIVERFREGSISLDERDRLLWHANHRRNLLAADTWNFRYERKAIEQ